MFQFVALACMVAMVSAQYHDGYDGGYGGGNGGGDDGGYGGHNDYHQPIPYKYGFDIHGGDEHHGDFRQSRQEHGDGHGNVQGSYSYSDSHGNHRQVQYVADKGGFRADVRTNEPGTGQHGESVVYGGTLGGYGSLGHSIY